MTEIKKWYESKTVWINIVAFIALSVQSLNGFIISPEEQAALLTIVNLILRVVTNTGIER